MVVYIDVSLKGAEILKFAATMMWSVLYFISEYDVRTYVDIPCKAGLRQLFVDSKYSRRTLT